MNNEGKVRLGTYFWGNQWENIEKVDNLFLA